MISYDEALKLLKKYLKDDQKTIRHCITVSDFAFEVAKKIKKKHPSIDPEKIRVVALLHDIGKDQDLVHQFEGKKRLEQEGLHEFGEIVSKHLEAKEIAMLLGMEGDFEPKTIEEKIVAYADLRTDKMERVDAATRIKNKSERALRKKDGEIILKALELSKERLLKLEKEINGLL